MNFTILDGSDAGQTFILGEEPILVGREEGGVRITDDRVSRRHARLERRGESVIITDLGSSNGTLVNGRLVEEAELREGDVITFGKTRVRFGRARVAAAEAPLKAHEASAPLDRKVAAAGTVMVAPAAPAAASESFSWLEVFETAEESVRPLSEEKKARILIDRDAVERAAGAIPLDANLLYAALVSLLAASVKAVAGPEPLLRLTLQTRPQPQGAVIAGLIEQGAADINAIQSATESTELAEALKPVEELGAIIEMPGADTGQIFLLKLPPQPEARTAAIPSQTT